MTNSPEPAERRLRDALRAATARQPVAGDRVAAVGRAIVRRRRQRERLVAGAVALSLVTGLAVLRSGGADEIVSVDDSVLSASPRPSGSPEPEPSESPDPEATESVEPSGSPDPSASDPSPSAVPTAHTVVVTADDTHVKVGEVVTFTVEADGHGEWPRVSYVEFGDGRTESQIHCDWDYEQAKSPREGWPAPSPSPAAEPSEEPSATPSPLPTLAPGARDTQPDQQPAPRPPAHNPAPAKPQPQPTEVTETYRYAYRQPGTYTFVAHVTNYCEDDGGGGADRGVGTLTVVVGPGPGGDAGNGPVLPEATFFVSYGATSIEAYDADGWITSVTFDWGDGGPVAEWTRSTHECEPPGRYWNGSRVRLSFEGHTERGSRRGVVTVRSVACDGGEQQGFQTQRAYPYPPPQE